MKIIRKQTKKHRNVTLRLSEEVMRQIDELADKYNTSRQKLIDKVLRKALADKSFVIELED